LPHSAPSQLWRISVQLYNGPLRSCRKIGKQRKQQCSRAPVGEHAEVQAQDAEWAATSNKRSMKNDQNPATAHHTIMTARRADNIRSSILVQGRSIRSMARSGRQPRRQLPRKDSHFCHFGELIYHKILFLPLFSQGFSRYIKSKSKRSQRRGGMDVQGLDVAMFTVVRAM